MVNLSKFFKDFRVFSRRTTKIGKDSVKKRQITKGRSIVIIILGLFTFIGFFLAISSNLTLREIQSLLSNGG